MGIKLSQREFEEAIVTALKTLPKILKKKMENMDVVVEDRVSSSLMEEMGLQSPFDLLGLYQGIPYDRRGFYYGNVLPDKITLFKEPLEALCRSREEIEEKVREVVIHEVGHYFGLDEETMQEMEGDESYE